MKKRIKGILFLAVILLILATVSTSLAIDTLYRNGSVKTGKYFRVFTPDTNDWMNGKPLILFFATGEQRNLDSVLAFVNKYHLYDELDINLMCVSFAGNYSQKGWENVAEELAEYLKQEWEKHPFPIIIDCAGNGAYGGCCMAQALSDRGMNPAELNLGDGADPKLVTSSWIRQIAEHGVRVNLCASGASTTSQSVHSRELIGELSGTENFHGEVLENVRPVEVLWRMIRDGGLHAEYTCWDVLSLRRYQAENGTIVHYCVYLPSGEEPGDGWPVLIYFHGMRDTMGKLRGPGQLLRTGRIAPKGIVILPQAVRGTEDAVFHTRKYQDAVIELAGEIAEKFNGNLRRFSVSGHSDGGTTAYQIVNAHPGIFAACAPVSGVGTTGEGIKKTWLWVFQGAKDPWVKAAVGLRVVLKCEAAGCKAMHYVYEDEGHEIQTKVFLDTFVDEHGDQVTLMDWLMSKEL